MAKPERRVNLVHMSHQHGCSSQQRNDDGNDDCPICMRPITRQSLPQTRLCYLVDLLWTGRHIHSCSSSIMSLVRNRRLIHHQYWSTVHSTTEYYRRRFTRSVSFPNIESSIKTDNSSIASCTLLVLIQKVSQASQCHLFGILHEQPTLPLMLPHKKSSQHPMYSAMSFKCRSSASLSSNTLVPSRSTSRTMMLPKNPEKAVGLGIYTHMTHPTATFLTPRPSLSSIRTHTTLRSVPHDSPVPPLPTYFPERYRKTNAPRKGRTPPRRPPRPECAPGGETVRLITPPVHPALRNLQVRKESVESMSSIYSRSISGEKRSPRILNDLNTLASWDGGQSYNTAVKQSRLGDMETTLIWEYRHNSQRREMPNDGSDSDIDDTATLQARLPRVRGVSGFGAVENWTDCHTSTERDTTSQGKRSSHQRRKLQKCRGKVISQPAHVNNNGAVERTYRLVEPWKHA